MTLPFTEVLDALLTRAREAEERCAAERKLELAFLRRWRQAPERLGLQTAADAHGARRLEADLARERLHRCADRVLAVRAAKRLKAEE